jgi:glutaredoxin 3
MAAYVKIYTRQGCGYCTSALRLLERKQIAYEHYDASGDNATRTWLAQATGSSTVPQVFINGKAIGGCDDLTALERRGELDRLIAQPADAAAPAASSPPQAAAQKPAGR